MFDKTTTDNLDFNRIISNSEKISPDLQWHISKYNKIIVWINASKNVFSIIKSYIILIISTIMSTWYSYSKIINGDVISQITQYAIRQGSELSLAIICTTLCLCFFIKNKYK